PRLSPDRQGECSRLARPPVAGPGPVVPVAAALTLALAVTVARAVVGGSALVRPAGLAGRGTLGRLPFGYLDRDEGELAAVVDLADLDLDLLADLDHIVHVVDPRAAVQLADLGDVQQAVLAGKQRDEGAERGGLHHGTEEALAHLGDVRVGDRVHRGPGGL